MTEERLKKMKEEILTSLETYKKYYDRMLLLGNFPEKRRRLEEEGKSSQIEKERKRLISEAYYQNLSECYGKEEGLTGTKKIFQYCGIKVKIGILPVSKKEHWISIKEECIDEFPGKPVERVYVDIETKEIVRLSLPESLEFEKENTVLKAEEVVDNLGIEFLEMSLEQGQEEAKKQMIKKYSPKK